MMTPNQNMSIKSYFQNFYMQMMEENIRKKPVDRFLVATCSVYILVIYLFWLSQHDFVLTVSLLYLQY